MIQSVNNYPVTQLLDIEANVVYSVPKYQREYTWGKIEWEELFDDIRTNEEGYFLGSIICINQSTDALSIQHLELVDGQQRLTSISLLFAAIFDYLDKRKDTLDDDQKVELINLKRRIILKKDANQIRVEPSYQNHNFHDYCSILSDLKILSKKDRAPYAGNRKILKAFRYFQERLAGTNGGNKDILEADDVFHLLEKVGKSCMVKIEVASHAEAYILFESLNNRGVPLTAVDLIKNKLLAKLDQKNYGNIDDNFIEWNRLLGALTDDYAIQERFFRQYYNAFKKKITTNHYPLATRSNLISIYEKMIDDDPRVFFQRILAAGDVYRRIIQPIDDSNTKELKRALVRLERISGAPSHLLLLYLFHEQTRLNITDEQIAGLVDYLVSFFVRRHVTDRPPTRDLTRLFMQVIEKVDELSGDQVINTVKNEFAKVSASDQDFREHLQGPIYQENTGATRFILCALEEKEQTKETAVDLWAMEGKLYVWTIEHIFPQGANIPETWIGMIANGNKDSAKELQEKYAHQLGNLTISGFNSVLGNKSFEEKRDRKDRNGKYVGYKNGLFLNRQLAAKDTWTVHDIEERTRSLVDEVLALFSLYQWQSR